MIEDNVDKISSKRVLAFLFAFCAFSLVVQYWFTGKTSIELFLACVSSSAGFLGITIFDGKSKSRNNEAP